MSNKVLFLTAIVLVSSAHAVEADIVHSTWVGGEQGEWARASNWDPYTVPDNSTWRTYAVTIDSNSIGVDEVGVGLLQSRTIDQLDCYGQVELQKWTSDWVQLTILDANGLTNYGELEIGKIDIIGNVTNKDGGDLEFWEHMNIYGNLINDANAILKFGPDDVDIEGDEEAEGGVVENDGLIVCTRGGGPTEEVLFNNRGRIQLFFGHFSNEGVFNNDSTGDIEGCGDINSTQLIQNKGTIYASNGSLLLHSYGYVINTKTGTLGNKPLASLHIRPANDMDNLGTIEVNAGGGVAFDCNMVNEPNAVIKLLGGTIAAKTITQSAGAIFEGFGGITGNVMINPNGLIELTGPTNIVGDVTVEHNAVLEISNGQTLIVGHTTNNGEIRVVNGNVVFHGGYSGSGIVQKD